MRMIGLIEGPEEGTVDLVEGEETPRPVAEQEDDEFAIDLKTVEAIGLAPGAIAAVLHGLFDKMAPLVADGKGLAVVRKGDYCQITGVALEDTDVTELFDDGEAEGGEDDVEDAA